MVHDLVKLCNGCNVKENAFIIYNDSKNNLDNWLEDII